MLRRCAIITLRSRAFVKVAPALFALALAGVAGAYQGELPIPAEVAAITSESGQQRLLESAHKRSYWPLAAQFETQKNQAYCSVATSVIALNALGVDRPATPLYPDYPYFTQQEFFAKVDPKVASPDVVAREGMTLAQLGEVLKGFGVRVDVRPAASLSLDEFRNLIRTTVNSGDAFALMNYDRKVMGEMGGGHWSPLAAYHQGSDSVLILDVARYKYPPVWVAVDKLWEAGKSPDSVSKTSRGVIVVRRP